MCLERIIERSATVKKAGVGWKVFNSDGVLPSQGSVNPVPRGKWLHERDYRSLVHKGARNSLHTSLNDDKKYPYGWHIHLSPIAARDRCRYQQIVRKVRYRKATTLGTERRALIVVAKELFIEY